MYKIHPYIVTENIYLKLKFSFCSDMLKKKFVVGFILGCNKSTASQSGFSRQIVPSIDLINSFTSKQVFFHLPAPILLTSKCTVGLFI